MIDDPRSRNKTFSNQSGMSYLLDYTTELTRALKSVDGAALDKAIQLINHVSEKGGKILVAGNGGSAAIGDHLCCDWTKGTAHANHPTIRTQSLSANSSLFTALANDFGYPSVFSKQVGYYGDKVDALVAISSSGNSDNIVNAVTAAKAVGMQVIGLSGFDGGKLRQLADISLHVDVYNYGVIEDCHQSLLHIVAQVIATRRDQSSADVKTLRPA